MYPNRVEKLRAKLVEKELDALWVTNPANVCYLSGFSDDEAAKILITQQEIMFYTDKRYSNEAEQLQIPYHLGRESEIIEHLATIAGNLRLGFEAEHITFATYQKLNEYLPQTKPVTSLIENLRMIKEASEIELIRRAAEMADGALGAIRSQIREGIAEREIAINLEYEMRQLGADDRAFETIVASGPRGALPHGRATNRVIQQNEFVTIDYGAKLAGYHSDATRSFAVGEPDEQLSNIYQLVLHAGTMALAKLKPGLMAKEIDAAARQPIQEAGYGAAFCHPAGHGVGLFIHEGPKLDHVSEVILQPGMVITIEPGIYLDGIGGVRIEDLVLITENGFEVLTKFAK